MSEIIGNRASEAAAIAFVIAFEAARGRDLTPRPRRPARYLSCVDAVLARAAEEPFGRGVTCRSS